MIDYLRECAHVRARASEGLSGLRRCGLNMYTYVYVCVCVCGSECVCVRA